MANQSRFEKWLCGFPLRPTDTVVDIGCYEGAACEYAARLGARAIGIDMDEKAVQRATERIRPKSGGSFQGLVSDCNPIPLPEHTATVVICTEVLEHTDDPEAMVRELARIGKPGARYFLTVPDPVSESLLKTVAPAWYFQKPIHQNVIQRERLRKMVTDAGLEIVTHTTNGFFYAIWWVFRMSLGMETPCDPTPRTTLLTDWESAYEALLASPNGAKVSQALDELIPKSQIIFARKPGLPTEAAEAPSELNQRRLVGDFSHNGATPVLWKSRVKQWVKDGHVSLGKFHFSWHIRRAS
jgi:2-polyprenyl-3-methyl-5-hydroxy-6-metoxy-1,4-benzoquinol methylase